MDFVLARLGRMKTGDYMTKPDQKYQKNLSLLLGLQLLLMVATQSWSASLPEPPADMNSRAVHSVLLSLARAGKRLVVVGERGFILTSDDDGRSWQSAQVPVSETLVSVFFISEKKGWAVGHGGVVLYTEDGGRSWQKRLEGARAAAIELSAAMAANNPPNKQGDRRVREAERLIKDGPDKPFLDVHFFDEQRGLVVGAYGLIFVTEDAGQTWQSLIGNVPNRMGMHLYDIHVQGSDVYLVGEQGSLFRTHTVREPFVRLETPYEGTFFGMLSSTGGDLILFGLRGNILRSSDRGGHWTSIETKQPVTLTAGTRLANGDLILVDETGQVLRSSDDGEHFVLVSVAQPSAFTDVTQSRDGALITSGIRGISRVELQQTTAGIYQ